MTDRELLELAAKAAGIKGWWLAESKTFQINTAPFRNFVTWNPLADDGDALRLAVKLEMFLEIHQSVTTADIGIGKNEWVTCAEKHGNDPYAATRRAIVRAAAEIGKEQP